MRMKKSFLLSFFVVFCLNISAQNNNDEKYEYYINVTIEYGMMGQKKPIIPLVSIEDRMVDYIYNENGEKIKFANRGSLINFFIKLDWTFVQVLSHGNIEHFYFKKLVSSSEEVKKGLIFKDDLKKK